MNNRMYEICGNCGKRYGLHIDISCPNNFNSVFEPTGKYEGENISDKIQMTEEQAREIVSIIEQDFDVVYIDLGVEKLKKAGYIIKSELQQKVEEAENFYAEWKNYRIGEVITYGGEAELVNFIYETMQLLKQSHPEFKK